VKGKFTGGFHDDDDDLEEAFGYWKLDDLMPHHFFCGWHDGGWLKGHASSPLSSEEERCRWKPNTKNRYVCTYCTAAYSRASKLCTLIHITTEPLATLH
jgi:hypothetical protein